MDTTHPVILSFVNLMDLLPWAHCMHILTGTDVFSTTRLFVTAKK